MTSTEKIGIASSYIAKTSNIQSDFAIGGVGKITGGLVGTYTLSTSTTPSLTGGTALFLYCSSTSTANCTFSSPTTGQSVFIANDSGNSGNVTLGSFFVVPGKGGLAVYDGSSWITFFRTS